MATFSRRATFEWSGDVLRGTGAIAAGSEAFTVGATFPAEEGCTIAAAIRGTVAISVDVRAV